MLMGKMPVERNDAGKMIALDRENIPKEVRALWGQYDDSSVNFAKTLSVLANHNAQTRMDQGIINDGLAKGYLWQQSTATVARPPGLVKMTTDAHSPMADVWGPPELKDALSEINKAPVRSLFMELNSVPLMMKTVGSVGSAVRNFFGNPMFMLTNGNLLLAAVHLKGTGKSIWLTTQHAANTAKGTKERARMIELGVLDESVDAGVLDKIAKTASVAHKWEKQAGLGASVAAIQRSFVKGAEVVATPFKKIYTAADNFWRLTNYNVELQRQKAMNPHLSQEEQEQNAADLTRKLLPTYSNLPDWARGGLSKGGGIVAPYFAFQIEALRTYASAIDQAATELGSSNWKERRSGINRLAGLLLSTAAPTALGMAAKAMFGYDDDDEEALRNSLPEYQRNNNLIMLPRAEDGSPRYLDLTFMNPYNLLSVAGMAAKREGLGAGALSVTKPLRSLQPGVEMLFDLLGNRRFRGGKRVYDSQAKPGEVTWDIAKRILETYTPGTAESALRIAEAATGKDIWQGAEEKTGKPRVMTEELMRVFPGAAPMTLDRARAIQSRVAEYKGAKKNASDLVNAKAGAKGHVDPGEVEAATEEATDRLRGAFDKMTLAYKQMRKLGMSEEEARKQMEIGFGTDVRKAGLPKKEIRQIITGNFRAFKASRPLRKEMQRLHPERLEEYQKAVDEIAARAP